MKKTLFGLAVAFIAFFVAVFATELFRLNQKLTQIPVVEEIQIAGTPILKVESLRTEEILSAEDLIIENNFGWYTLENYKGMKEVNMISLWRDYEESDIGTKNEKLVSGGGVFTSFEEHGDQGFVESAWAEVDDKKARFRTNKIKGIEYRFEGVFYNNKTSGKNGEKVLRGTLKKFVKGKKIAEVSGDFAYSEPQCWH